METIDFYDDSRWGLSGTRTRLEHRERIALRMISGRLQAGQSFLDIGCGEGYFLSQVARAIPEARFTGADYSPYKLEKAKQNLPFRFSECNLENSIPFEDGEFDMIYSGEVIEHLYNPDLMLREANRVLKKNGTLIISTPNLHAWYNRILFLFGIQPIFYETSVTNAMTGVGPLRFLKKDTRPTGHVRLHHKTSLRDLFRDNGFVIESMKGFLFEGFPAPVRLLDSLMALKPTLASGFVVMARKAD